MDGVSVPIGREWREAKAGQVYRRRGAGGVEPTTDYAALSDSKAFGRRLQTVAQTEGFDYCRERARLGAGAEWIWQEGAKHFDQTAEIVDLFHVLEYLLDVAQARFPESAAAKAWADEPKERLLKNQVKQVMVAVAA
jgi:hypothetical protein